MVGERQDPEVMTSPFRRSVPTPGANLLDPLLIDYQWRQIRIGKVAVILCVFLGAHGARLVTVGVVEPRFLLDGAAVFDHLTLAPDLEFDGVLQKAEAVQVLDLAARTELRFPR